MKTNRSSIAALARRIGKSFAANVSARLAIDPKHFDRIDCRIDEDDSESWAYDYWYSLSGVSAMPILLGPESEEVSF